MGITVASPMVYHLHALLLCRVELCTSDGRPLNAFPFDSCSGGPHEARGMRRSALLCALASALPEESVIYGAAVARVSASESGRHLCSMHACYGTRWC